MGNEVGLQGLLLSNWLLQVIGTQLRYDGTLCVKTDDINQKTQGLKGVTFCVWGGRRGRGTGKSLNGGRVASTTLLSNCFAWPGLVAMPVTLGSGLTGTGMRYASAGTQQERGTCERRKHGWAQC